jgi:hypothetical protein
MGLVFYYVILPIFAGSMLIRWLKKASPARVDADVAALYAQRSVQKKWFRSVRRDQKGLRSLGDFETRLEAVEAVYAARKAAQAAQEKAAFVVLDDKGYALEQIDS